MQYGFVIPGGDVQSIIEMAADAEGAGWDGVFIPDCIYIPGTENSLVSLGFDPWVVLAAIAMKTSRIRMGTMLTPLSRRRPWKVARETATLDHLSNGRLVLPVGLGALDDAGFGRVGEATDRKVRAELLDESLDIITGLWSGKPFSYAGKHYKIDEMTFLPTPVQQPRIPIWVVGAWPHMKSMRRVLRYDGLLPAKMDPDGSFAQMTPDDIRTMREFIERERTSATPFDIIWEGETPGDDPGKAAELVRSYAEAGATWWLDSMWSSPDGLKSVRTRIKQGPPRID
jgi:alkanesulfonate monooxygenase SsuD/methylene tetrahydromethanopterin reductase-like flavin-dependent oxidoreductase (luciferase family)